MEVITSDLSGTSITTPRGPLQMVALLGSGSFGSVYKAQAGSRTLAVKALKHGKNSERAIKAEMDVLRIVRVGNHQHLVRYHGHMEREEETLLVFGLAPLGSLEHFVLSTDEGRLPVAHSWLIFEQLLDGIAFLHCRGVFHRDIKPANILLDSDVHIRIADFGLSVVDAPGNVPMLNNFCGTPGFVPPEFFIDGCFRADQGDIWAAVLTIVFATSGDVPWGNTSMEDPLFAAFCEGCFEERIWSCFRQYANLLLTYLNPTASERIAPSAYLEALHKYS